MKKIMIQNIPAVIYGEKSDKVYLFIHGKCGYKEEAEHFAKIASDFQILSIDLPEHGERKNEKNTFYPWVAVPEIEKVYEYMKSRWKDIYVCANSIGAYFSLLALAQKDIRKFLFVSPIIDMEKLIQNMMKWASVSEKELQEKGEIETDFGETLSWIYYNYAKENKIKKISAPVCILYGENDNLTELETINEYSAKFSCNLKVAEHCEHWFHTPSQIKILSEWENKNYK